MPITIPEASRDTQHITPRVQRIRRQHGIRYMDLPRRLPHIPLSVPPHKLESDWAEECANVILRRCPVCERDSIAGHGGRRKQAHDEQHDWIPIRRGYCRSCGTTFTFLPPLSLPYTHYSLLTRCLALRRPLVEHCS
jgi:hypothetical protein